MVSGRYDMKEAMVAFGIGAVNAVCATVSYQGLVDSVTIIANALVALISLGFGVYKIVKVLIKHFKEKHGEDCDCDEEIKDIIDKK